MLLELCFWMLTTCLVQSLETIVCDDTYQCSDTQLTCPSSTEDCDVECSGIYACSEATFNQYNNNYNGDLSIACNNSYACSSSLIYCLDNGNCVIDCSDPYACEKSVILCPTSNDCTVSCQDVYSCQDLTIFCPHPNGGDCNIDCSDDPDTGDLSCIDLTTLSMADISDYLTNGTFDPQSLETPAPTINTDVDGTIIICDDVHECRDDTLVCSDEAEFSRGDDCYIYCTNTFSCSGATFNAAGNNQTGTFYANCGQFDTWGCYEGTIHCFDYGECNIDCGPRGCEESTIYCPYNQDCNINCQGTWACADANIYCPMNNDEINAQCNVNCDSTDTTSCSDIKYFTYDGDTYIFGSSGSSGHSSGLYLCLFKNLILMTIIILGSYME